MSLLLKPLRGRTAIVTGSSSGNGRAIALLLAKAGANVVCSDLVPEARAAGYESDLNQTTHDTIVSKFEGKAIFQKCDTSDSMQVKDLVTTAVKEYGRLDIMVNNAGIFRGLKNILEETDEDFDRTMAINTRGVYLGCKHAIRQFLSQKPFSLSPSSENSDSIGKIVNIASMGGLVGLAKEPAYCASKGAVVNLTRQLAVDFGKDRINVNALCPGFLETAMVRPFLEDPRLNSSIVGATPWPRLGTAQDVASAALWLSTAESDWMTGSSITLDGGFTSR